jgi:hypothetical protein
VCAAVESGGRRTCLHLDDAADGVRPLGGASRWLDKSPERSAELEAARIAVIVRRGLVEVLPALAREDGARRRLGPQL